MKCLIVNKILIELWLQNYKSENKLHLWKKKFLCLKTHFNNQIIPKKAAPIACLEDITYFHMCFRAIITVVSYKNNNV